jgi:hypothetical protein
MRSEAQGEASGVAGMTPARGNSGRAAKRPVAPTPGASLPLDASVLSIVANLEGLDLNGLRCQWRARLGGEPPAHLQRRLLMRVLAYRLQSDAFGDLDGRRPAQPGAYLQDPVEPDLRRPDRPQGPRARRPTPADRAPRVVGANPARPARSSGRRGNRKNAPIVLASSMTTAATG